MDDALILTIDNREPIELAVLSRALSALSADYRRQTGRDLVLQRVTSGSTILWLIDRVLQTIGQADDLAEFARNLRSLWHAATGYRVRPKSSRRPGSNSVAELVELAATSHATITVAKKSPDGTEITFTVTPEAAHAVREHEHLPSHRRRPPGAPKVRNIELDLESYAKSVLETERESGTLLQGSDGRLELIKVLLEVIRGLPEGRQILDRVRERLRSRGYDPDPLLGV